ncbi:3-beta hydroxysteroid dehydrogenase [Raoultella terrigena]|uniref:3-beta hydroxysteroid dehydrogenase n=1 Tax=Raoultella terrigena TaxID=577 RepID=A0A7Z8ZAX2_RAOTE|nr:3-beta hydroxysteroid dehydrogenase [Raoultella terrigena]
MAWRTAPLPNHDEITNYGCLVMYSSHNIMSDNGFFLSAKTDTDIITAGKKSFLFAANIALAFRGATHFDWFAMFAAMNLRASSVWTRQQLNWQPTGPGLLDDLQNMDYASLLSSR